MRSKKANAPVDEKPILANPQTAEEFYERGWAFYSSKEYDKAEADFTRTLDLNPGHTDALYALGMNMAACGKTQEAVSTFEHTIELLSANTDEDTRVRRNMVIRLAKGHINRLKTGEWRLDF